MSLLAGRVALISGVGEGLGRDTAILFAREGADLVIAARKPEIIERVAGEMAAMGRRCIALTCDIQDADACQRVAAAAASEFGSIDVLVNVAYRSDYPHGYASLLDSPPDLSNWRGPFEVNVFGTLQMTRAVAHHMVKQRSGRIIMVNTMMSEMAMVGGGAYSGSKAALQQITKTLALELGPFGIRVNGMHPGYMGGPQVDFVMQTRAEENGTTAAAELKKVTDQLPLRYLSPTSEYAGTLLYLASDLSINVTGQSIHVNCGQWMS
ncbi:MAG: SDR family oxidoreductase [Steroidobacteraceae bacterium]